jgi:hypothetical protein
MPLVRRILAALRAVTNLPRDNNQTKRQGEYMVQLYFTRAKIFLIPGDDENGERRFTAQPSAGKPVPAPDWVRETATYKFGIKDRSIVDLTPPKRSRKVEPEEAPIIDPPVEPSDADDSDDDSDDDDAKVAKAANKSAKSAKSAKDAGKAMGLGR